MSNGKEEFNVGSFVAKGDSLYRAQSSKADVYDKDYPNISRFDKEGYVTDEYITRGLTEGKVERAKLNRQSYTYSGVNAEGEPVKGNVSGRGNMTPRDSYYMGEQRKIKEGMPVNQSADWGSMNMTYGREPRYSKKGNIISPHQLFEFHQDKTKGMDPFQKMDFSKEFRSMVKSMPTSVSTEDKIINQLKKGSN